MIDLVRKIQGEKLVIPKHRQYRSSRPLFSYSTINIFRYVIDNPRATARELSEKTGSSKAHVQYTLLNFYNNGLLLRSERKILGGIEYRYTTPGTKEEAINMADKEEARLGHPNLTEKMEIVMNMIAKIGFCTAVQLAESLDLTLQNARKYITVLLERNVITKRRSQAVGFKFEYFVIEASA